MNCAFALSDCALAAKHITIENNVLKSINRCFSFDRMNQKSLETRIFGKDMKQSNRSTYQGKHNSINICRILIIVEYQ